MAIRGHGSVLGAKCRTAFRRQLVVELLEDRTLLTGPNHPPVATPDTYNLYQGLTFNASTPFRILTLHIESEPGDFIGQGRTATLTQADVPNFGMGRNGLGGKTDGVGIQLLSSNPENFLKLDFAAPGHATLMPGNYPNARRFGYQGSSPGLQITVADRAPNDISGSFNVLEVAYDALGQVLKFDATFEQHADGGPALRGEIKVITNDVGVLDHDSDPDNNPLKAILVSAPSHGNLNLRSDGTFTYTPDAGFIGVDHFTYKANDGTADSNVGNVYLISQIRLSNILPVVVMDQIYEPRPNASAQEAFVKGIYLTVLGREADPAGLSFWVGNLNSGAARSTLVTAFWNSPENRGREVDTYYRVYLDRPADAAGRSFWVSQLQSGTDETAIVLSFLLSAEQLSAPNNVFVDRIYEGALGRVPSPSEINYWVGQLTQGATRQQLASSFVFSSEAAGVAVDSFYEAYLQRPSDPDGRAYWVGLISSRKITYASLAQAILESDEFFQNAGSHVP